MNRTDLINRHFKERLEKDSKVGGYPFVTISRQAGAGGHSLAEEILRQCEALRYSDLFRGWQIFDQELCEELARDSDVQVSMQDLLAEEYHTEIEEFMNDVFHARTPQYRLYRKMTQLQRTLAALGKVILVGRGASLATRDMRQGIRVRLIASKEVRVGRMMKLLHLSEEEAWTLVERHDTNRAHFVKDVFGREVNDPELYDAVWNTDSVPLSEIAAVVMEMVKSRGKDFEHP